MKEEKNDTININKFTTIKSVSRISREDKLQKEMKLYFNRERKK